MAWGTSVNNGHEKMVICLGALSLKGAGVVWTGQHCSKNSMVQRRTIMVLWSQWRVKPTKERLLSSQVFRRQSNFSPSGKVDIYQSLGLHSNLPPKERDSGFENEERVEGWATYPVKRVQKKMGMRREQAELWVMTELFPGTAFSINHHVMSITMFSFPCILSLKLWDNLWACALIVHFTKDEIRT